MKWMIGAIAVAAGLGLAGSAHALATCVKSGSTFMVCTDASTGKTSKAICYEGEEFHFCTDTKSAKTVRCEMVKRLLHCDWR